MQNILKEYFTRKLPLPPEEIDELAKIVTRHLTSPEFASCLPAGTQIPLNLDLGLGENVNNKWRTAMSALTDAMAAAINTLKSTAAGGGVTTQQVTDTVHSIVDPQVADLQSKVAAITTSESDDATKIADINAALAEFTTAFAPASTPAPAPTAGTGADTTTGTAQGSAPPAA